MTILDMAMQKGIQPKRVASTGGGEYHSSCPICGGTDRFFIQPNRQMQKCLGFYSCRQCGAFGDAIQFARQFLNYSFQEAAQAVHATLPEQSILPCKSYIARPITLQKPSKKWISQANKFVEQAHQQLLHNTHVLEYLEQRGLDVETAQKYSIGWTNKDSFLERKDWDLQEEQNENGQSKKLWIPAGIIIPSLEQNGEVIRLKVRRSNWKDGDTLPKYVAISGSMNGLTIINPSAAREAIVVVESEFDAYAVVHAMHGLVCTVAVGSNIKNPDNLTDRLAKKAKHLLICHDNDDAGKKMLIKWQGLYTHAIGYPTPIGKDIGEAIQQGINIWEWLLKAIESLRISD